MKNLNYKLFTALLAVALIAGITVFNACKKDTDSTTDTGEIQKAPMSNELQTLYKQLSIPEFGNIKLVNGDILKFESIEHYEQTYEFLKTLCDEWMALFLQTYDTGDEDELDETIEMLGFDERLPLIKFEQKYKKTTQTLQTNNALRENIWLAKGAIGTPPSDEITSCPIEQTLLSLFHEFCIDTTICQIRPDGYQILIPTSEISCLKELRNMSIPELLSRGQTVPNNGHIVLTVPPVTIIPPKSEGCYEDGYFKKGTKYNTSDYRFYWEYNCRTIATHFDPYSHIKTTVSMKNYKKNKQDEWVKDYGAFFKIIFVTQLCEYYFEDNDCIKGSTLSKTGLNTKVFSKSKRDSKRAELMSPWWPPGYTQHCIGYLTQNPAESTLTIRHRGVDFHINIVTGQ
jgi:hypothetical protein